VDKQPNNNPTKENPVGRFMVAVGAVIELKDTGKILVNQRASVLDWKPKEWEIVYGRIDQFETLEEGLKREVREEVGIKDLQILSLIRAWHTYRGSQKSAQNELIGITYHCRTQTEKVQLSKEHSSYRWVTPKEALSLITSVGIHRDLEEYLFQNRNSEIGLSPNFEKDTYTSSRKPSRNISK